MVTSYQRANHKKFSNHDSPAPAVPLTGQHPHLPFSPVGLGCSLWDWLWDGDWLFLNGPFFLPSLGQLLNSQAHCFSSAKTKSGPVRVNCSLICCAMEPWGRLGSGAAGPLVFLTEIH